MTKNKRWYLKRGDKITGPFPSRVISDYLLLGRIHDDDLLSDDQTHWSEVASHRELYPSVLLESPLDEARLLQARHKVDERLRQRRSMSREAMASERRKARDRRRDEDGEIVLYREQRARVLESIALGNAPQKNRRLPVYLIFLAAMLMLTAYYLTPGAGKQALDCRQTPRPGINWSYCKLQDIDLSNQDLSSAVLKDARLDRAVMMGARLPNSQMDYAVLYRGNLGFADLSAASLKGVDFRNADLSYVNFSHADLSYADLSGAIIGGADFSNAKLDNAIWVDQRTCRRGSIGDCLLN